MKVLTTSQLEENFENIIDRVATGETFLVKHNDSNFILIPYQTYEEIDELTRIYTEHNEGC